MEKRKIDKTRNSDEDKELELSTILPLCPRDLTTCNRPRGGLEEFLGGFVPLGTLEPSAYTRASSAEFFTLY